MANVRLRRKRRRRGGGAAGVAFRGRGGGGGGGGGGGAAGAPLFLLGRRGRRRRRGRQFAIGLLDDAAAQVEVVLLDLDFLVHHLSDLLFAELDRELACVPDVERAGEAAHLAEIGLDHLGAAVIDLARRVVTIVVDARAEHLGNCYD